MKSQNINMHCYNILQSPLQSLSQRLRKGNNMKNFKAGKSNFWTNLLHCNIRKFLKFFMLIFFFFFCGVGISRSRQNSLDRSSMNQNGIKYKKNSSKTHYKNSNYNFEK